MNPKQRVRAILNREPVDRIPVDLWMTGEVQQSLFDHCGTSDDIELNRKLGIDRIIWADAPYRGELRTPESDGEITNHWGARFRPIQAGEATYSEYLENPLQKYDSIESLDDYPWWPDPEQYDIDAFRAQMDQIGDEFPVLSPWVSFFEVYCALRGLENAMMDLLIAPDYVNNVLDRIEDIQTRLLDKCYQAAEGRLDMLFYSDDMGTQKDLMISADSWEQFIRPRVERFSAQAHRHGVKVFHHTDGAVRPLLPRLIEAGVDVLNPIQHICPGMDMAGLKQDFGQSLVFHGGVDTQAVMPRGTPEDVRNETRDCLNQLGRGGGFICCSCHNVQAGTPVENILAMIDTVQQEGAAPLKA